MKKRAKFPRRVVLGTGYPWVSPGAACLDNERGATVFLKKPPWRFRSDARVVYQLILERVDKE